jgi:hypothetical protein
LQIHETRPAFSSASLVCRHGYTQRTVDPERRGRNRSLALVMRLQSTPNALYDANTVLVDQKRDRFRSLFVPGGRLMPTAGSKLSG